MSRLTVLRAFSRLAKLAEASKIGWLPRAGRRILERVPWSVSIRKGSFTFFGYPEHWTYLNGLLKGLSEDFRVQIFSSAIQPDSVVLDIGAYIGRFSLEAALSTGPGGKVYSFEPDPRNHRALVLNVNRNSMGDVVVVSPSAVSDRDGKSSFQIAEWPHCGGTLGGTSSRRALVVDCVAIDSVLSVDEKIHAVKMDVEGAEVRALRGMERTLVNSLPNVTMMVECNPPKLLSAGESPHTLLRILKDFGFGISLIDETNKTLRELRSEKEIESFKGFLYAVGSS